MMQKATPKRTIWKGSNAMLRDLVIRNRSYRRFDESAQISLETLRELVDLGRLSASGRNIQPLKYYLSADAEKNALIFPTLSWAGYIKDGTPPEGEHPTAYIIMLLDTRISPNAGVDHGISAQSILLGAAEKGLGGCMVATVRRNDLKEALKIPDVYEIQMVLALGKPIEEVVLEDVGADGNIHYYRDSERRHHVPKRRLDDVIIS